MNHHAHGGEYSLLLERANDGVAGGDGSETSPVV